MTNLRKIASLAVLGCMLFAAAAQAQPKIAVYIGDDERTSGRIDRNMPIDLKIYIEDSTDLLKAAEYKVNLPGQVAVLSSGFPFSGAIDLGSSSDGVAVGFGECVRPSGDAPRLIHTLTVWSPVDQARGDITITAATVSEDNPTAPRFVDCADALHDLVPQSASLRVGPVDNDGHSFGAVKALF